MLRLIAAMTALALLLLALSTRSAFWFGTRGRARIREHQAMSPPSAQWRVMLPSHTHRAIGLYLSDTHAPQERR